MKKVLRNALFRIFGAYPYELRKAIHPYKQILDVGCGENSPIHYFSDELDATGVDGYAPAIAEARKRNTHKQFIEMDLRRIGEKIPEDSYDCVVSTDVIEHFEKDESERFIRSLEKIARKRVIVMTPNGFVPQEAVGGNEFQIHRCGWEVDELEARGYSTIGIYGHKALRGELAEFTLKPRILGRLISDATQPFVRNHPKKAFSLLAVKNL